VLLDVQRAVDLELEDADAAVLGDPVDLRAERSVPLARDVLDPLEEPVLLDAGGELRLAEEPVLAPVDLAGPLLPGRRRDGNLQLVGQPLEERADERALARARRTGDDEDGTHDGGPAGAARLHRWLKRLTSSVR
jgi:hypothetical protein